ncbi:hypothetical protein PDESU_06364 [Pontiella desulfatans]|uniref:Uncharacterized protein n=1 Tax=Pontiella desulfatans TaxID=2750659 RepID=A0A6C2UC51_PONDE|nr:hypothetical protein PDESU_06364 [Pontiella desulfatans]
MTNPQQLVSKLWNYCNILRTTVCRTAIMSSS